MTEALADGLIESDDDTDEFVAEMLRLMHDAEAELPREWVLQMLTLECAEARKARRLTTFNTRGRFLRLMVSTEKPWLTELTARLVNTGVMRMPLHRGY